MPKKVAPEEKRVKLNCFVAPATMNWIRNWKGGSQGSAVDVAVVLAISALTDKPKPSEQKGK